MARSLSCCDQMKKRKMKSKQSHNNNITWELKMKRLFVLLIAAVFVFVGCSDESGLVNPEKPAKNLEWLSMSPAQSASRGIETSITTTAVFSKEIDGSEGGKIDFDFNFTEYGGQDIKVKGRLNIPKNAFEGTMNISMLFNDASPYVNLSPSGYDFNKELKLNLRYKNLNLDGINPGDQIEFAYIDSNGETVVADYQSLQFDLSKGKVKVQKALIPHFSRFGFVKADD